jgi:acetoin utilization deacetylase AcuC-like enzyme
MNTPWALPVFFSPQMLSNPVSFSPSAGKPARVVASWQRVGIPLDIRAPMPVTLEQLQRAHDPAFVAGILEGRIQNGFNNTSPEVAASLPWTTGAMLSAARHAIATRSVAAAPCSGFHHAGWALASGYCTFNGLMVTAATLKLEGFRKIGILDCDMHFGDGTADIIEMLNAFEWVNHFTAGQRYEHAEQAEGFFARLPQIIESMKDCDVVLYQAGADPHVDDPYGGWLTTAQLRARDAMVFEQFRALGVPVAWNLAGGYQVEPDGSIPKVLEIHDNTARECMRVYST